MTTLDEQESEWRSTLGVSESEAPWPSLSSVALQGLAGHIVGTIAPTTEADPAALLVSVLAMFGAAVGPSPYFRAGGSSHGPRLFVVVVGQSAKARKGTSYASVRPIIEFADGEFVNGRIMGGFGSGESLVDAVTDLPSKDDDRSAKSVDRRLLIHEGEFARVLKVCGRDSSTLSPIIRAAWDGTRLEARSRSKTSVAAPDAHVAALVHITAEELRKLLTEVEIANGLGNRFLFACARRAQRLSRGGGLSIDETERLGLLVRGGLVKARRRTEVGMSAAAWARWDVLFDEMADDDAGGIVGALASRAEAQVRRIALVYALLDSAPEVALDHMEAAWALWCYCRESVAHLFGEALGDANADKLLAAIRDAGERGLPRTAQSAVFGRNIPKSELDRCRTTLVKRRLIIDELIIGDGGRAAWVSRPVSTNSSNSSNSSTQTPQPHPLTHDSLSTHINNNKGRVGKEGSSGPSSLEYENDEFDEFGARR